MEGYLIINLNNGRICKYIFTNIKSDGIKRKMSLRKSKLEYLEGHSVLDLCRLEIMYPLTRLANGCLTKDPYY